MYVIICYVSCCVYWNLMKCSHAFAPTLVFRLTNKQDKPSLALAHSTAHCTDVRHCIAIGLHSTAPLVSSSAVARSFSQSARPHISRTSYQGLVVFPPRLFTPLPWSAHLQTLLRRISLTARSSRLPCTVLIACSTRTHDLGDASRPSCTPVSSHHCCCHLLSTSRTSGSPPSPPVAGWVTLH